MPLIVQIIYIFLIFSFSNIHSDEKTFLYFKKSEIETLKEYVKEKKVPADPYVRQLKVWADALLSTGPWSIADSKSPSVSNNPNDYYSESPYWWPDPDNPAGPYIRKDGLRNPKRFMAHKEKLIQMYQASFVLILAGYLFDNQAYLDQALNILEVWFIDPQKRMNPHMDYAQAIPNKSPGRGVGIIDGHRFTKLLEAFYILDLSGKWPPQHKQEIKKWFREFLHWLLTSANGLDEKKQGNNHTTWWCALVAAISRFVEVEKVYKNTYEYLRSDVLNEQIKANGSMPHEEKRTRSFDYMCFNLDAFALVMKNYFNRGLDSWEYPNDASGSVKKTLEYFYPYASGHLEWPFQQITAPREKMPLFWYFAGQRFENKFYIDLYRSKMQADELADMNSTYDPFLVLINLILSSESSH